MRSWLARMMLLLGRLRARPIHRDELNHSAMVFAPHPDDETLGCGGLIARKVGARARVWVVFMTDGRCSHAPWMAAEQLIAMRKQEALAACKALGVPQERVFFLDYSDGQLLEHYPAAVQAVKQLLDRWRPRQVLAPCHAEATADHIITNRIVREAVAHCSWDLNLMEYAIWFWQFWPWVKLGTNGQRRRDLNLAIRRNIQFLRIYSRRLNLADALAVKRSALSRHCSQIERPPEHPDWPILQDVWDGNFLKCCLRTDEFFTCYPHRAAIAE